MSTSMDLYEANTHVFVVKIWLEESSEEGEQTIWRGHITYLLDGKRSYIQDLDDVANFILPYLERIGVKGGQQDRLNDFPRRIRLSDRLRRIMGIKR